MKPAFFDFILFLLQMKSGESPVILSEIVSLVQCEHVWTSWRFKDSTMMVSVSWRVCVYVTGFQ